MKQTTNKRGNSCVFQDNCQTAAYFSFTRALDPNESVDGSQLNDELKSDPNRVAQPQKRKPKKRRF